ncbi:MAG: hypothetical protein WB615_04490 [Candidatus Tumulicola sp.]
MSLLAACSGGNVVGPSATTIRASTLDADTSGLVAPDKCAKAKIYVADYLKSDVEVYSQGGTSPTPCRKITAGVSNPEGIYVDAKGTLYVANYIGNTITEYPHGGKTPAMTITPSAPAYDVFVGVDRTLYAAEPAMNQVAEYPPGAPTPSLTLAINGGAYGVATDKQNNLYVSYLSNSDGVSHVEEFAPGATTGTDLALTVSFAGELKLDKHNDVIIGDRNNDVIDIFPPGATTPSRTIPIAGKPVYFCLDQTETQLYVSSQNQVQVFNYQSGAQVASITSGIQVPSGVAARKPAPY